MTCKTKKNKTFVLHLTRQILTTESMNWVMQKPCTDTYKVCKVFERSGLSPRLCNHRVLLFGH
jgi:hypothetical protein